MDSDRRRHLALAGPTPDDMDLESGDTQGPKCAATEDADLVERAVAHIRGVLAKTVARGIEDVGEYLLAEFYRGDPELYRSLGSKNHASLRLLEDRCESLELPVTRTFLSNALRMAVALKTLPAASKFLELPPSHRIELIKIKNPGRMDQIAERAVEGKLTVRKLRSLVERERKRSKSTRGRRPTPPLVLAVAHCLRELRDPETGRLAFRRDDLAELDEHQNTELVQQYESLRKRVEELGRLLG